MMERNLKPIAIISTLLISFLLAYISIEFLGEYGWTVFILIPFLIGFLPPYIIGREREISLTESYLLSFMTLGLACLGLLVFALEGIICIVMASPILLLQTWLGAYLAYRWHKKKFPNSTNMILLLLTSSLAFMSFDYVNRPLRLIPVSTEIIVDAPINTVWKNVITFDKIDTPMDWIFKTGISYPTDATIKGRGVGAIRYCNFTTGSFVEPITTWEEPTLLQFDVKEQPIPMNEMNPFWEVHPPHLDGYFKSYKGQFELKQISDKKTSLIGTTWYQVDITPEIYWRFWSDFIVHRIHLRVLNHIKESAEEKES